MTNISIFDYEPSKQTAKAKFFAQIEPFLPIGEWMALIAPHYHVNPKGGNPPKPLEIVLRCHLVQQFYDLSYEATEDAVVDIISVRNFVGISPANERDIPDSSTLCRFNQLLVKYNLTEKIFAHVLHDLEKRGFIVKKGTIVDSSIIETSTSKKNKDRTTDGKWTKKAGNHRHGYKSHIGVDADTGFVTSNLTTEANVHDAVVANDLLHGEEEAVYGDSGYLGIERRRNALAARKYRIMKRPSTLRKMLRDIPENQVAELLANERIKASIRAKVEHVFAIIKRTFGFRRCRTRGLPKIKSKLNMLCALSNLWKLSRA